MSVGKCGPYKDAESKAGTKTGKAPHPVNGKDGFGSGGSYAPKAKTHVPVGGKK